MITATIILTFKNGEKRELTEQEARTMQAELNRLFPLQTLSSVFPIGQRDSPWDKRFALTTGAAQLGPDPQLSHTIAL